MWGVTIDLLLMLALPASGKSEIRRYLEHLGPDRCAELYLGPTVQVDDYPYVHLMRRISEEQRRLGHEPAFFDDPDSSFRDRRDWLTLTRLIGEDIASLTDDAPHRREPEHLIRRLTAARQAVGIDDPELRGGPELAEAIAPEAAVLTANLPRLGPDGSDGATTIVEFARGGPHGARPPLPAPLGYAHSLPILGPEALGRASILYVWVTPEESRRRNRERALPGAEGDASILHHGVPEEVMLLDYGMDDMNWLQETSPVPGTIAIASGDDTFLIPIARFDNRVDRTSFLRDDPSSWDPDAVTMVHDGLADALGRLVEGVA